MALEAVRKDVEDGALHMLFVWIDMLEADDVTSAVDASQRFSDLTSAGQFHDPRRAVGRAVAHSIGAGEGIAWDFYLVYRRGQAWAESAPPPSAWFHQLRDEAWAGPDRFRWGPALGPALRLAIDEVLNPET